MRKNTNGQEGFLKLIFIIIVALLLMKYFGITVSETIAWFKAFFASVFQ